MDADPEGPRRMARFLAGHGVTGWLPTTMTATGPDIERALAAVRAVAGPVDGERPCSAPTWRGRT